MPSPAHTYVDSIYGDASQVLGPVTQWDDANFGIRTLAGFGLQSGIDHWRHTNPMLRLQPL